MIASIRSFCRQGKVRLIYLIVLAFVFGGLGLYRTTFAQNQPPSSIPPGAKTEPSGSPMAPAVTTEHETFQYFGFIREGSKFSKGEQVSLFVSLGVAICALLYAGMLVG